MKKYYHNGIVLTFVVKFNKISRRLRRKERGEPEETRQWGETLLPCRA